MGLIRRALLLRAKHRVQEDKERIPSSIFGAHPSNRAGVYPMKETVMILGVTTLEIRFSVDEANHEGVCLQEAPAEEALSAKLSGEGSYETSLANNKRKQPRLRLSIRCSARLIPLPTGRCRTAACY